MKLNVLRLASLLCATMVLCSFAKADGPNSKYQECNGFLSGGQFALKIGKDGLPDPTRPADGSFHGKQTYTDEHGKTQSYYEFDEVEAQPTQARQKPLVERTRIYVTDGKIDKLTSEEVNSSGPLPVDSVTFKIDSDGVCHILSVEFENAHGFDAKACSSLQNYYKDHPQLQDCNWVAMYRDDESNLSNSPGALQTLPYVRAKTPAEWKALRESCNAVDSNQEVEKALGFSSRSLFWGQLLPFADSATEKVSSYFTGVCKYRGFSRSLSAYQREHSVRTKDREQGTGSQVGIPQ